jgi:hypothetical protein
MFVLTSARNAVRHLMLKEVPVRILARSARVEVRELPSRRSSSKMIPWLFAVHSLRLVRLDSHRDISQIEEKQISTDELVTMQFLEEWQPGYSFQAAESGSKPAEGGGEAAQLNLHLEETRFAWFGPLMMAWMIGGFAWLAKPDADGEFGRGVALKLLVFAGVPALIGAIAGGLHVLKERRQQGAERVAVQGYLREKKIDDLIRDLSVIGVKAGDDVRRYYGDDTIRFCEYTWGGKVWRSTSLWCQPPDGQPCPGRLNPKNPRDVKWGDEP